MGVDCSCSAGWGLGGRKGPRVVGGVRWGLGGTRAREFHCTVGWGSGSALHFVMGCGILWLLRDVSIGRGAWWVLLLRGPHGVRPVPRDAERRERRQGVKRGA